MVTPYFSHVPADGARLLAGGVRGVVVSFGTGGIGEVEINNPRLNHRHLVVIIDFEDIGHSRHLDDDTPLGRHRAAAQSSAGAAGEKGSLMPLTALDNLGHFFRRLRKNDGIGPVFAEGEAVAFVDQQFGGMGDDPLLPEERFEVFDER